MNFESRHPEPASSLLPAGQGGDLNGKGADILLIPHIEVVPGQVDGGGAVVGLPVVRGAEGHSTFFGLPGQVPGGVLHNPGLHTAFLQDAFSKALHGHGTDLIPEYL